MYRSSTTSVPSFTMPPASSYVPHRPAPTSSPGEGCLRWLRVARHDGHPGGHGEDRVRSPGDDLMHLLRLLVADVAVGVAKSRLLAAQSGATHVARRALPVQGHPSKGPTQLPIEVSSLLIGFGVA